MSKHSDPASSSDDEEARQSFRGEAARAWRDYERDGKYATQAEVDAWIDSLGARYSKRSPKQHE